MYLVNYTNGWDIFSNNRSLPMILAHSDEGNISFTDIQRYNNINSYLNSLAKNISKVPQDTTVGEWKIYDSMITSEALKTIQPMRDPPVNTDDWPIVVPHDTIIGNGGWANPVLVSTTIDTVVYTPHFMTTLWGQGSPWNTYIPYCGWAHMLVGCSAVAVGQFLYCTHFTYGRPLFTQSVGLYDPIMNTYSFSNPSNTIWNSMAKYEYEPFKSADSTAVFLGYIAKAISTNFGLEVSTAYNSDILPFLFYNGFVRTSREYPTYSAISTLIQQHRPLIMEIAESNETTGHLLVVDAIKKTRITRRYQYGWLGTDNEGNLVMTFDGHGQVAMFKYISYVDVVSEEEQIQMNWGWGGYCNDIWFSLMPSSVWSADVYNYDIQYVWLMDFAY